MTREEGEKKTLFPNKEARYLCWSARDLYWECLDKFKDNSEGQCDLLRKAYVESCPPIWVKHFDKKKKYLAFQEKMKQGYDPVNDAKFKNQ